MMLDKYFPDKNEYQSFLSHLLSNIPNIESADILSRLQDLAASIKKQEPKATTFQEELSFDDIYIGKPVANVFDTGQSDGTMSGVPVSNGECEGIVRIVHTADDANQLQKGEIMVARFTDIGWTPYYSMVNGLITEIGSSLSHGAVVGHHPR